MAEPAANLRDPGGALPLIKKRWRAWLRAVHRDIGYLAIGFTVIYAVSGIAQNHIEDWGDVSYRTFETTQAIAPIADDASDAEAIAWVAALVDREFGAPTATFRAGDEVRLEYANGSKVTVIGSQLTIQGRERRAFIGAANWLHTARNKQGWKYVADAYAVLLLYLAISGIFMIKGRLGLKWRGAMLIGAGVAVPVAAVLLSSPGANKAAATAEPGPVRAESMPVRVAPPADPEPAESPDGAPIDTSGIKFLPAEADDGDGSDAAPNKKCDPFSSMRGC
jgi:uncharacterized protein